MKRFELRTLREEMKTNSWNWRILLSRVDSNSQAIKAAESSFNSNPKLCVIEQLIVLVYQIQNAPVHQVNMHRMHQMHQTSKGHVNGVMFSIRILDGEFKYCVVVVVR